MIVTKTNRSEKSLNYFSDLIKLVFEPRFLIYIGLKQIALQLTLIAPFYYHQFCS